VSAVNQKSVWPLGRIALVGVLASILPITASLADPVVKPPVPIGVDPGGVLIALIGEGVDYTNSAIAKRLARDGEGELIGWDFIDRDRRPYQAYTPGSNEQFAVQILANSETNRLAVFRPQPGDQASVAQAIGFAVKAAARISFVGGYRDNAQHAPDFQLLAIAAAKFPDMLFIAPAGDKKLLLGEAFNFPNVIVVAASDYPSGSNTEPTSTNIGSAAIDIAAAGDLSWQITGIDFVADGRVNCTEVAAARLASLAARILTAETKLTGAELKQRILALAKPFPDGVESIARSGWIEDPATAFP
jgi:hypothetical protein